MEGKVALGKNKQKKKTLSVHLLEKMTSFYQSENVKTLLCFRIWD